MANYFIHSLQKGWTNNLRNVGEELQVQVVIILRTNFEVVTKFIVVRISMKILNTLSEDGVLSFRNKHTQWTRVSFGQSHQ